MTREELVQLSDKYGTGDDTTKLFECVDKHLNDHGVRITVSTSHVSALVDLSYFLVLKAHGCLNGRHYITLPAGFGKSTALKCLIRLLYLKAKDTGGLLHPVAINIERVEDIEAFYKDLIDNYGIDENYLLRIHSDLTDHDVQLQNASLEQYYGRIKYTPFVIMTHARLADPRFEKDFYEYESPGTGKKIKRALFWDEEIQPAITSTIKLKDLLGEIDRFTPKINDELSTHGLKEDKRQVLKKIGELFKSIRPDLRKHRESAGSIVIGKEHLSALKPHQINWLTIDGVEVPDSIKKFLLTLLEDADKYCDISKDSLGDTYVLSFRRVLPDSVTNLTVLDASVPLRPLAQIDTSFETADISVEIDYSDVVIQIDQFASGRTSINKAFSKSSPYHSNPYINVIREHIASTDSSKKPEDKTLIICHKDIANKMLREFKGESLDVAHFGAVNGRNEWSDFHRCILSGQFREPELSYRCKVAARLDDKDFSHPDLERLTKLVADTDFIHHAYQGANRVRCRRVHSDSPLQATPAKAQKAEIYMVDSNPEIVKEYLQKQMPTATYIVNSKRSEGLPTALKEALREKGDDGRRKGRYDDDIEIQLIRKLEEGKEYSRKDLLALLSSRSDAESIVRAFVDNIEKFPAVQKTGRGKGTKYSLKPTIKFS